MSTVAEVQALAKLFLDEGGTFWPAADLLTLTKMANRLVYRAVATKDPSHFAEYDLVTYPASTEGIDLTGASYLNASIHRILGVDYLPNSGAVSESNVPVPMEYQHPESFYEGSYPSGYPYNANSYRWTLDEGFTLRLKPIPGSATYTRVRWIRPPRVLTATTDTVLVPTAQTATSVWAEEYHDLVVATLARIMSAKERREALEILSLTTWIESEINNSERDRIGSSTLRYDSPY